MQAFLTSLFFSLGLALHQHPAAGVLPSHGAASGPPRGHIPGVAGGGARTTTGEWIHRHWARRWNAQLPPNESGATPLDVLVLWA